MKTGIFLGRFQPFHKGHLNAIKQILQEVDFIKIIIGSSNKKRTAENPLSYLERKKYIQKVLPFQQYSLLPLPDTASDQEWFKKMKKIAGSFDRIYVTDNPWTEKILKGNAISYTKTRKRLQISATQIRDMIRKDKKNYIRFLVKEYFPKSLEKIIRQTA
jgi:nicotinamide-nucleotide adenylyltransferase